HALAAPAAAREVVLVIWLILVEPAASRFARQLFSRQVRPVVTLVLGNLGPPVRRWRRFYRWLLQYQLSDLSNVVPSAAVGPTLAAILVAQSLRRINVCGIAQHAVQLVVSRSLWFAGRVWLRFQRCDLQLLLSRPVVELQLRLLDLVNLCRTAKKQLVMRRSVPMPRRSLAEQHPIPSGVCAAVVRSVAVRLCTAGDCVYAA